MRYPSIELGTFALVCATFFAKRPGFDPLVEHSYLNKPLEIFDEMYRVLRPGGKAIMSFSNRCFPSKAIQVWTQTDDAGHLWIVGSYFKFTRTGKWSDVKACDISPAPRMGDPMFVVEGTK